MRHFKKDRCLFSVVLEKVWLGCLSVEELVFWWVLVVRQQMTCLKEAHVKCHLCYYGHYCYQTQPKRPVKENCGVKQFNAFQVTLKLLWFISNKNTFWILSCSHHAANSKRQPSHKEQNCVQTSKITILSPISVLFHNRFHYWQPTQLLSVGRDP